MKSKGTVKCNKFVASWKTKERKWKQYSKREKRIPYQKELCGEQVLNRTRRCSVWLVNLLFWVWEREREPWCEWVLISVQNQKRDVGRAMAYGLSSDSDRTKLAKIRITQNAALHESGFRLKTENNIVK